MSSAAPAWDYAVIRARLTDGRLESYLRAAGHDLEQAFCLYEWNIRASAAVLATAAMVEVVVRNALDGALREWVGRRRQGQSWFDVVPLDARGREDLAQARLRARRGQRGEVPGRIIAELPLGFWRYLVTSRYLTTLWIPSLHTAFPAGPRELRQRRAEVEARLQRLAFVRNRAAHHEPIHRRDLRRDLVAAVELTGWVCSDSARWVAARSPLPAALAVKPVPTTLTG